MYSGIDIKNLKLLGTGTQGKVYKIDEKRCIKIFKNKKECSEELNSLIIAQGDNHFPRLYTYGEDFIIRECINGLPLDEYLKNVEPSPDVLNLGVSKSVEPSPLFGPGASRSVEPSPGLQRIFHGIIELYEAMRKVGYSRLDAAIFHVFVTSGGELKLIDTAKAMRKSTEIPSLLISGIEKLKYKEDFFNYIKKTRPDLYSMWKNYRRIDYKKKGL